MEIWVLFYGSIVHLCRNDCLQPANSQSHAEKRLMIFQKRRTADEKITREHERRTEGVREWKWIHGRRQQNSLCVRRSVYFIFYLLKCLMSTFITTHRPIRIECQKENIEQKKQQHTHIYNVLACFAYMHIPHTTPRNRVVQRNLNGILNYTVCVYYSYIFYIHKYQTPLFTAYTKNWNTKRQR